METYAQWNEQLQKPYNEQPKSQVKLPHSSGQEHRMTPAQLAKHGRYRVQRIEIAEGERLDNETWEIIDNVIVQQGTIIDAQTVAAEAQAARLEEIDRMIATHGNDVAILGKQLAKFTDPETGLAYAMPIDAGKVINDIKTGIITDVIPESMIDEAKTLEQLYRDLRAKMTDEDIAAVASYLGGQQ